ncbi:sulfotransferase domain-containing protein [Bauldia litoralis]|uniref:sulfotransferase domain-containing protein n=1 Tax=Bauldia litoralis TaxID=665467 RepID=UPI00329A3E1B
MITLNKHRPRGIIWLASYPRSGNTWSRAFIHALVNVVRDPDYSELDINRIEQYSASESAADLYRPFLGKPAFRSTRAEIAAARPKVQAEIVTRLQRPVFIKTHNANATDNGAPTINMSVSAGAVYILRNPLDVAISFAHFRGVSIDQVIDDMATSGFGVATNRENVHIVTGSWTEHVRSWTDRPHPVILTVRYEDLVEKPTESFGAIARHLLMTPEPAQLEKAIAMANFDTLREKEAAAGFVEKPETSAEPFFRGGKPGQWREVLTPIQVDRVVSAHRAMMSKFKYLPD